MPFGHTNALVVFMDLMYRVCKMMLDRSVIMFIDGILVYSKTRGQYEECFHKLLGGFEVRTILC